MGGVITKLSVSPSRPKPTMARAIAKLSAVLVPLRAGFLVSSMLYGVGVLLNGNQTAHWEFAYFLATLGSALDLMLIFLPKRKLPAVFLPPYACFLMLNLLFGIEFLIAGNQTWYWRLVGMFSVLEHLRDILSIFFRTCRCLKQAIQGHLLPV